MMNKFATGLGSVLLACGICSPAAGSINNHAPELVFWGLTLVVAAIYADYQRDKRNAR